MAQFQSDYELLVQKLNAMAGSEDRFSHQIDKKYGDRVTIRDKETSKSMPLNLTTDQGNLGKVWLIGSDIGKQQHLVGPEIHAEREGIVGLADRGREKANIQYTARDSTTSLAGMVLQSFKRAGYEDEPGSIFHGFLQEGDERLGYQPAPTISPGYEATQEVAKSQLRFTMASSGRQPSADEANEIYSDFIYQAGYAHRGEGGGIKNIKQDAVKGAADIQFQSLQDYGYMFTPKKQNTLNSPYGVTPEDNLGNGMIYYAKDPGKTIKSNTLSTVSDPVNMYRMDSNRRGSPSRITPNVITNADRAKGYVTANSLVGNETTPRALEVGTFAFTPTVVAGGGYAYFDPNDQNADFYGKESDQQIPVPMLNMKKLQSGEQSFEFEKEQEYYGFGRTNEKIGVLRSGKEEHNIDATFGSGKWRSAGPKTLQLPQFHDPVTGEFSAVEKEGYIETEGEVEGLSKKLGMQVKASKVKAPKIVQAGTLETQTAIKGFVKTVENPVGGEVFIGNTQVTHATGETKGPELVRGFMNILNFNQLNKLAGQYGGETGAAIQDVLQAQYSERAARGESLNVDWNEMAQIVGHKGGGGLGLQLDMYENTIMAPNLDTEEGRAQNRQNEADYGTFLAEGGETLPAGVWSQDQINEVRLGFDRKFADTPQEERDRMWNDKFKFTKREGYDDMYSVQQTMKRGEQIVTMGYERRAEYYHGANLGSEFLQALNRQSPEVAKASGVDLETWKPDSPTQQGMAGLLKWSVFQGERQEFQQNRSVGEMADVPEEAIDISDDQLLLAANLIGGAEKGQTSRDILSQVSEQVFPNVAPDALLYNKTLDKYIMNPKAALATTYDSDLGVQAQGIASATIRALSSFGNIIGDENIEDIEKPIDADTETNRLLTRTRNMIGGGKGSFFKNLFSKKHESALSGKLHLGQALRNDEVYAPPEELEKVSRQAGLRGKGLRQSIKQLAQGGLDFIATRQPMVNNMLKKFKMIGQEEYEGRSFETKEAAQWARGSARHRGGGTFPMIFSRQEVGDWDNDPFTGMISATYDRAKRTWQGIKETSMNYFNLKDVNESEAKSFPHKGYRDKVASIVQQMGDVFEKNPAKKAVQQRGAYSYINALEGSVAAMGASFIGMGTTYNIGRSLDAAIDSTGASPRVGDIARSVVSSNYQTGIDKLLQGREATGTQFASMIAGAQFRENYKGEQELYVPTNSVEGVQHGPLKIERPRQEGEEPQWSILPSNRRGTASFNLQHMFTNRKVTDDFRSMVAGQLTHGFKVGDDYITPSKEQFAALMSVPGEGEYENLLGRLDEDDTGSWQKASLDYTNDLRHRMKEEGMSGQAINEKILSALGPQAIIINAASKAESKVDPLTGEETPYFENELDIDEKTGKQKKTGKILGAVQAFKTFASQVSRTGRQRLAGGVMLNDLSRRFANKNLRSLHPRNVMAALSQIQDSVPLKMMANVLGISNKAQKSQLLTREQARAQAPRTGLSPEESNFNETFDFGSVQERPLLEGADDLIDALGSGEELSPEQQASMDRAAQVAKRRESYRGQSMKKLEEVYKRNNFVTLDTETTGLGPDDEPIQVSIRNKKGKSIYQSLVQPTLKNPSDEVLKLTGIDRKKLEQAPTWEMARKEILRKIKGKDVLAYNSDFDLEKMQYAEEMTGHDTDLEKHSNWVDVAGAAREYQKGQKSYKQTDVAQRLGVSTEGAHDAGADTGMLHNIVGAMAKYSGWDEKPKKERKPRSKPASNKAASGGDQQPPVVAQPPVAAGQGGAGQGGDGDGGGPRPPVAAAPGGDDPDDPNKNKNKGRRQLDPEKRPADLSGGLNYVAPDVAMSLDQNEKNWSQRATAQVRGTIIKAGEYEQGATSALEQMDKILEGLGFGWDGPEKGRLKPKNVRARTEKAFMASPTKLQAAMPQELRDQVSSLKTLQADTAKAHMMIDKVNLGDERGELEAMLNNSTRLGSKLGGDMSAFASMDYILKGKQVKNRYKVQQAHALAENAEFQKFYQDVNPIIGGEFSKEKEMQLRTVMRENPMGGDFLKQAVSLRQGEKAGNLPRELVDLADFARNLKTSESGSKFLKSGNNVMDFDPEALDRVNKAFEKFTDLSDKATEALEKGNKRLSHKIDLEAKQEYAAAKKEMYGALASQQEKRAGELQGLWKQGVITTDESREMLKAQNAAKQFRKYESEAALEQAGIEQQRKGPDLGAAARRVLGGFGLMYARSIWGMATEGQGFGMAERNAFDLAGARAGVAVGGATLPYNQANILQTSSALSGMNRDPRQAGELFMARNPLARDAKNAAMTGLSTWGYTQFFAGQIGSAGLAAAALPLAGVAIGGSMLLDANARLEDEQGLAYRQASGKMGITDYMALGMQKAPDRATYDFRVGQMRAFQTAAKGGATMDQLMAMQSGSVDLTNFVGKDEIARMTETMSEEQRQTYMEGLQSDPFTRSDIFALAQREIAEKYQSYSPDAQAGATVFAARAGLSLTDDRLQGVLDDIELGGGSKQALAQTLLQAGGYTANTMYAKGSGQETNRLSALQLSLTGDKELDEAGMAKMQLGAERLSQLQGGKYIEGWGSESKSPVTDETMRKFVDELAGLSSTTFEAFKAQQNAAQFGRMAGMEYAAPKIEDFSGVKMSEAMASQISTQATAFSASAQSRLGTAQAFATNAYNIGEGALAESGLQYLLGGDRGDQWRRNRMLSGDPLMMAQMSLTGGLDGAPGLTNIQGQTVSANMLANTDISNQGRITGLGWGSTGLQRGQFSANQMGQMLFGNMNNIGTQAMVEGVDLREPITLSNGQQITNLGGQMGLTMKQNYLQWDYQEQMRGFQNSAMQRDYDYQMKMWGLQDQQRALGFSHQQKMFGFQEQGLQLQERGIDMNNRFFWQNAGLQQQQTTMQRGWQRQDWAFNDETRAMQWGWRTEDFQEERRFMTGRQRRLAERQMERETTMHGREEDKIARDKARQEELWKLEDTRFDLQKAQHTEQVKMQREQLALSRKQFEENKKYFLESKKLEDEIIKLQREHWLAQHKASKQQLAISHQYEKDMLSLKKTSDTFAISSAILNGELNTLVEDSLAKFQEWIIETTGALDGIDNSTMESAYASEAGYNTSTTSPSGGYTPPVQTPAPVPTDVHGPSEHAGGGPAFSSHSVQKVGEEGWEYVINGMVIPHGESVQLEKQGVRPGTPTFNIDQVAPQTFSSSSGSQSSGAGKQPLRQTIVVQIGNHELKRYVVDAVAEEF